VGSGVTGCCSLLSRVIEDRLVMDCADTKTTGAECVCELFPVLDVLETDEFFADLLGLVDENSSGDGHALAVVGGLVVNWLYVGSYGSCLRHLYLILYDSIYLNPSVTWVW
jgi:hypothetical protein